MSENEPKTLTLAEFVKEKKQIFHDEAVRCKTYAETSKGSASTISAESFWQWMEAIHFEMRVYIGLLIGCLIQTDMQ